PAQQRGVGDLADLRVDFLAAERAAAELGDLRLLTHLAADAIEPRQEEPPGPATDVDQIVARERIEAKHRHGEVGDAAVGEELAGALLGPARPEDLDGIPEHVALAGGDHDAVQLRAAPRQVVVAEKQSLAVVELPLAIHGVEGGPDAPRERLRPLRVVAP